MKNAIIFAALAAMSAGATAQERLAGAPHDGLYVADCRVRQFSDRSVHSFMNFQIRHDAEKGNYVLNGLVDELIECGTMSRDGEIRKVADITGTYDEAENKLILPAWQHVMRQQDSDGVWHDVYFTGGFCGYDFMDEETLKQTDNNCNLAVKDMDIELTIDNSGGYTSLYTQNGFFFVWENAPDDEIRFHYCDYFSTSGNVSQFNAIGNAEAIDEEEHLPVAPHTAIYIDQKGPFPYHAYVDQNGDMMSITNWQYGTYSAGLSPAVTFHHGDDGVWHGENLLAYVFGNPLYVYLWQIDDNGDLIGSEMNYSVTLGEDEWGNTVVTLPPYRRMMYTAPEGGKLDYRTSNVDTEQKLTVYRTLPRLKDPGGNNAVEHMEASHTSIDAATEYFNLQGMRIEHPASGSIVIECRGSSVRKIVF